MPRRSRQPPPKPQRRKPGQGGISFHRPSGLWRATLPPKLDPKQAPAYFQTREDAVAWLDGEIARRTAHTAPISGRTPLGAYLAHYLARESASARWSPRTLASAITNGNYLRAQFDTPLGDVTRGDLQAVVAALQTDAPRTFRRADGTSYERRRPLGAGALHNAVGLWRRAFAAAVEDELIARNPCARLTLPPQDRERADSWTPAEARRIVPTIRGHRFEALYALIFGCGLRISEARGLAWADVDWEQARARIRRGADGPRILERVKGRAARWVPLLPPVVAALRRQRQRQDWPAVYVSEWDNGRRVARVSRDTLVADLKRLAADAGVRPFPPHAGRHAVGNVLGAARVPLSVIADRLRHRSRSVTADWYISEDIDGEAEASRVLEDLFGGPDPGGTGTRTGSRDA